MRLKRIISLLTIAGLIILNCSTISSNMAQLKNITILSNNKQATNVTVMSNKNLENKNLNINKNSNFSLKTNNLGIKNNAITLKNEHNQSFGTLKFDPITNKLKYIEGNAKTPYASKTQKVFSINLYSSTGELVKSVNVYGGNQYPEKQLSQAFNNLDYTYGDIIQLIYQYSSIKLSVSDFNIENYDIVNSMGFDAFEIEPNGLKQVETLNVNPIYYTLNSNKTTVSGTTTANTQVNIWIDNKDYTTTSNADGNFSLKITALSNITNTTSIMVVSGGDLETITPQINPNVYGIENSSINLFNKWYGYLGTISFEPQTSELQVIKGYASTNTYASSTQELFAITLLSSNGQVIKTVNVYGNEWPEDALYNAFNNLKYTYGDIIQITYPYSSSKINISNIDGKTYNVNKTESFVIEKSGLKEVNTLKKAENTTGNNKPATTKPSKQQINTSNIKSNSEDIYWDNNSLVINGNLSLNTNALLSKNVEKQIVIENSSGNTVATSNTVPVNWYSSNKNNYSGYQGIFTESQLSNLKYNKSYNIYVEINGKLIPISNKIELSKNKYTISSNNNGQLTITRTIKPSINNTCTYETGYFTNYGYVINGNINQNNTIISKSDSKVLLIKNLNNDTVDKINCVPVNWYSNNKNNYSGFQAIITNSQLNSLVAGQKYTFDLEVTSNNKTYTYPLDNNNNVSLTSNNNYSINVNNKNNLTISKNINTNVGIIQGKYLEPYGYVMNIKLNISKNIPKKTKINLIYINESGKIVSTINGVNVNWYSNNKDNYNGFQVIVTPKESTNISAADKMYAQFTLNGQIYTIPIVE